MIVLLIIIYRSPVFWFFPILAVVFAEIAARGFGYGLTEAGVTVNGQSSSILSILVIGAGTDYALLLVARYREELRRHEDKHEAMAIALRRAGPAIFASGLTVCAALLSLSLAKVNGTAGLGPIGAMGIAVALLVMLTFLPAILLHRRPPAVLAVHPARGESGRGRDARLLAPGRRAASRAAGTVGVVTGVALLIMALGLLNFSTGLTQSNPFRDSVESIEGQELIAQAFPLRHDGADRHRRRRRAATCAAVAAAARGVDGVGVVPARPVAQGDAGVPARGVPRRRPVLDRGLRRRPAAARRGPRGGAGRARRRPDRDRARPARGVRATTRCCSSRSRS